MLCSKRSGLSALQALDAWLPGCRAALYTQGLSAIVAFRRLLSWLSTPRPHTATHRKVTRIGARMWRCAQGGAIGWTFVHLLCSIIGFIAS